MDSDIKTRVTPLDELKLPNKTGHDCLVVIYSSDTRQLGKRHLLGNQPVSLGRGSDNTIVLENDSVSRRHCKVERRGATYHVVDLDSTNGTYVNDQLVKDLQLRRGDQVKVGDTIFKFLSGSDMEAQYHETIYRMTIVDGLTGVNNKRFLLEALEREIPRGRRHDRPLTLVMLDIDHFKHINDTYGHLAGDYILKEMAQLIKNRLRPDDVIGRYGGEEFGILLPETDLQGGAVIAEQLRKLVAEHSFVFEQERINVTISMGLAQLAEGWDVLQFIKHADERLYEAKRGGRNRVAT
ncbi:MAG: diguanylate cyclase [Myxococcales bacterium]|nr:diguanylate cyclase [Myxococcales bacterium]